MEFTFYTNHEINVVLLIIADPNFTLYKILDADVVRVNGNAYEASFTLGFIVLMVHGVVYLGNNKVSYKFNTIGISGGEGGFLEFTAVRDREIKVLFEYEGKLGSFINFMLGRRISKNIKKLDEEIRLERIKRKI
ncbi:STK_08120 family protein [Sulfurisphaera ohwakuensis]|uniref:STK_08120 family protein n=1 Tax=Sulfurisphaera ohwakuensis TaxID=69656 RepID=UPI0036F39F5A